MSRSKIELYVRCPRCFYLDRRCGISQPPCPPFSLNTAVDALLKKEFDVYRKKQVPHPLMVQHEIDALPFDHQKIDEWRDSLHGGITYLHVRTNFLLKGGIDDVWINPRGELIIVDYKATAKKDEVTLDAPWQMSYKRQMELYQWLFRRNDFPIADVGYFLYCNGVVDTDAFDNRLDFRISLLPYEGSDEWVEPVLEQIKECLDLDVLPQSAEDCAFCAYRRAAGEAASLLDK